MSLLSSGCRRVRWKVGAAAAKGPPYLKVGRLVKYRPEDIEAYKAARLRANLPFPGRL